MIRPSRASWPLLLLVACSDGIDVDDGLDASLVVSNGTFFRSSMPAETGGPQVITATLNPIVRAGQQQRQCTGVLEPASTAVAIGIDGDIGYWVVRAGIPDVNSKTTPSFSANLSFGKNLAVGDHRMIVRAVDQAGHFGAPAVKVFTIQPTGPTGHLIVTLAWGNRADLDLHVVDPNGVEVFSRNISSYVAPPPGKPEAPGTPHDGGVLDFDSNAQCVQDGRMAEDVVWTDPPPKGHYVVRVDTADLCGEVESPWRVEAKLEGVTVGTASGIGTVNDTRFPHELGGGVLALEFDVP